jgi:tRNA nucleotidyltransferase (CCA-adding enzyme)
MQIGLSRYELKKGHHYHDYDLVFDNVNVKKTVIRRDFSINALLYDYNNKKMIDLVNGINDLNHRLLRMVNKHKFSEDSSRVLRLLKFKFTYNLDVEEKTRKQAIKMDSYLWEQPYYLCNKLFKSIIKAPYFDFDDFAYYLQHFLLIDDLIKCISRSQYHPEKTLYNHIKGNILALQLFMDDLSNKEYYLLFWTLFFHDYGKIVNSKKHAQLSVEYFEKYQLYFFDSPKQITLVKELINDHMRIREYALSNKTSAMARLKQKYGHDFKYLEYVGLCDYAGRSIDFSIKEIKMRMTWFEDNVLAKYRVIK